METHTCMHAQNVLQRKNHHTTAPGPAARVRAGAAVEQVVVAAGRGRRRSAAHPRALRQQVQVKHSVFHLQREEKRKSNATKEGDIFKITISRNNKAAEETH